MDTELTLWTDSCHQYRQVIMGPEKRVLYDRYKKNESFKTSQGEISIWGWSPWNKVKTEHGYIHKAYFIRKLTVEDLILDNVKGQ